MLLAVLGLGTLVNFLIGVLVALVILYAVKLVLRRVELPADIQQLVLIIIGVILLIALLGTLAGGGGFVAL